MKVIKTDAEQLTIEHKGLGLRAIVLAAVFILMPIIFLILMINTSDGGTEGEKIIIPGLILLVFILAGISVILFTKSYEIKLSKTAGVMTIKTKSLVSTNQVTHNVSLANSVYLSVKEGRRGSRQGKEGITVSGIPLSFGSSRQGRGQELYQVTIGLSDGGLVNIGPWIDSYAEAAHTAKTIADFLGIVFKER